MGNYYGYMRISTQEERGKQHYSRQEAALMRYASKNGIEFVRVYYEDKSGKSFAIRPEWGRCEKAAHAGDTIVFKDLSRFTREAEAGYQKYMELMTRGVNLVFIDNPTMCTDYIRKMADVATTQNLVVRTSMEGIIKLLLIVELDRVEQERLIISQRTKDGMVASPNKAGRKVGSLDKWSDGMLDDMARNMKGDGVTIADIMTKYGLSRNTVKKYMRIAVEKGLVRVETSTNGTRPYRN